MKKYTILTLFCLLFAIANAIYAQDYHEYALKKDFVYEKVFSDDFNDNANKWGTGYEANSWSEKIDQGEMIFASLTNQAMEEVKEIKIDTRKNFEIETAIRFVSGAEKKAYGLIWGKSPEKRKQFDFMLSPNGMYSIDKFIGNYYDYVPFTPSTKIKKDEFNTLTIRKVGYELYFFINRQFVWSIAWEPFFGNHVGFQVPENSKIAIDYLYIDYFDLRKPDIIAQKETKNNAIDKTPPRISIINPIITRGFRAIVKKKEIQITGRIEDENEIKSVLVNNKQAIYDKAGNFMTNIELIAGQENKIHIKAIDQYDNTSEKELSVSVAKASDNLIVNWKSPKEMNVKTSNGFLNLLACVQTTSEIKSVNIYKNDEFCRAYNFEPIIMRGDCNYSLNENIELEDGVNKIRVEITSQTDKYIEEITAEYNRFSSKNYALIIGMEEYDDKRISHLDNPVKDAENLASVLSGKYMFNAGDITLLKNPTKADIIGTLHKMRGYITESDNLLIFYAGHGIWDEGMKVGYWLPKDANKENPVNWLPNTDLTNYIGAIKSRHTLLIADACFSGSIFKSRSAFSEMGGYKQLYDMTSRKAMTSGTLKEVPDKSVFIKYLLKRLTENAEKFITAQDLFSSLKSAVINNSSNIPQYGTIQNVGDEGGDFVFIKKE